MFLAGHDANYPVNIIHLCIYGLTDLIVIAIYLMNYVVFSFLLSTNFRDTHKPTVQ